jgi:hypothetical protein
MAALLLFEISSNDDCDAKRLFSCNIKKKQKKEINKKPSFWGCVCSNKDLGKLGLGVLKLLLGCAQAEANLCFGFGLAHADLGLELQGNALLLASRGQQQRIPVPQVSLQLLDLPVLLLHLHSKLKKKKKRRRRRRRSGGKSISQKGSTKTNMVSLLFFFD